MFKNKGFINCMQTSITYFTHVKIDIILQGAAIIFLVNIQGIFKKYQTSSIIFFKFALIHQNKVQTSSLYYVSIYNYVFIYYYVSIYYYVFIYLL